jgi:uncharacterized protein
MLISGSTLLWLCLTKIFETMSEEEEEDFLLSCRYGELDEVKRYIQKFGRDRLLSISDENGSNCLHMSAGNGHDGVYYFHQ